MLKPERWQQVEKIFNEALERDPHERQSFLDQACGDDSWLKKKVEALLRSDEGAASFLESPAATGAAIRARTSVPNQFIGRTLGPYEIQLHIGSGGMGDVYRARDTKLRRDVAIKILPPEFTRDPDRVARFRREAVALAALNHPNIAAIHDLEEIDGTLFLVLEFVEGETLAARLKRGALDIGRAVQLCKQVAEGLEAAHTKGINHRDLKPHNIQITHDDRVKLLDFGLAKMLGSEGDADGESDFRNLTQWNTQPGIILGTAPYLSPEQARGQQPDKRSDIWAFGCVLFETITGKQAFPGETITDVLAAILKSEPDWALLPSQTPPSVQFLLRRCLQKEAKQRPHEIADVRMNLVDALSDTSRNSQQATSPNGGRRRGWNWVSISAAAIFGALLTATAMWTLRPSAEKESRPVADKSASTLRFSWTLPQGQQLVRTLQRAITISPDGASIVYVANDNLYLRRTSGTEADRISSTMSGLSPAFSPDGQWLAFWSRSDRTIKKLGLGNGSLMTLAKAPVLPSSLNWEGDTVAYATPDTGIVAVRANGGVPEVWVEAEPGEILDSPQIVDGGTAVLFSSTRDTGPNRWDKADVVMFSRENSRRKVLIQGGSDARYIPTGHIVYVVGNTLFGVPFNLKSQTVTGPPVPILQDVLHAVREMSFWPFGIAQFALSFAANGTLIYVPANAPAANPSQPNREIRAILNWFDELRRRVPSG